MTHERFTRRARTDGFTSMLHRGVRGLAALVVGVGLLWAVSPVDPAPAGAAQPAESYYLSVGDSLAQGFQPIGGPGSNSASVGYHHGYADQLWKLARQGGGERLRLVKLGCGGESTETMIGIDAPSQCPGDYDTGSQLGDAVEFLEDHPGQVAFITINIGANDIFQCEGDPSCFVPQIATNLPHILATLREHAGPGVPIVGANSYTPFVADWFVDPAAGEFAAAQIVAFNGFLEGLFAGAGVPVADVESAFAVTDFTTQAELKRVGPVPLSVYNVCTLTWMCHRPPLGPDIHPNREGYRVMAEAFAAELGL